MKKIFLFISVAFIGTLATMSCNNCKTQPDSKSSKNGISDMEVVQIFKNAEKSYKVAGDTTFGADIAIYAQSGAMVQWITKIGDNNIKTLQDSLLAVTFGKNAHDADSTIFAYVNTPEYASPEKVKLEPVDTIKDLDNARIMTNHVSARIIELNERVVSYKIAFDSYQGGAHPSYSAMYLNYGIKNNLILNFKSTFKPGSDKAIMDIVVKNLMEQKGAKNMSELSENGGIFVDQLFLTHNFYFTSDGITFVYNPYEIGPWAIGSVEVKVPEYQLEQYLSKDAASIFAYPGY